MVPNENKSLQAPEGVYCHQLETLRDEIRVAMSAISENALGTLENSLWRQEVLCTGLTRLLQSLQDANLGPSTLERVQVTAASLHALNQTYSDLVHQARTSTDLMYTLCQNYQDSHPRLLSSNFANSCSLEA